MKKLMTSTIILLPIIVLAIMLVSGAVMSLVTHIYVESVEFTDRGTLNLIMDDEEQPPTEKLEVNVFPMKAKNREVFFKVEDESIATVSADGVVTAKFYGTTYVTVTSVENGAATQSRKIVVTDTAVHALRMNEDFQTDLYEGSAQPMSVTVFPEEAENKKIHWSSSDESILRVSADGTVTAVGEGEAVVTATSDDNSEVTATASITCHRKMTGLEADTTTVVTAFPYAVFGKVTPLPEGVGVSLTYTSSDSSIATVDSEGNITFNKEGKVIVTVQAEDFGGVVLKQTKEFSSTNGYFVAPLFDTKQFTVDYDEYANGEALPIVFAEQRENATRQIDSVEYSEEGILTFDETSMQFQFQKEMPVGVRAIRTTVHATVYDEEKGTLTEYIDYFDLTVLRNADSVSVSYDGTVTETIITSGKTLTFTSEKGENGTAYVQVLPENHTNKLQYTLEGTAASISEGIVTFQEAGTVTVKISLVGETNISHAEKEVTVIYAPLAKGEKAVDVRGGTSLLLTMKSNSDREEGVILFTEPADATVSYTVQGEAVTIENRNGVQHIVPQKGGFATVKVSVSPEEGEKTEYTVHVYVDCPVSAENFTLTFGEEPCPGDVYGTPNDSVSFGFEVNAALEAMQGKRLYVNFTDAGSENLTADGGVSTLNGEAKFGSKSNYAVTFGVEYTEEAKKFGVKTDALNAVKREVTVWRDAASATVSYQDVETDAITTQVERLTFGEQMAAGAYNAYVNVLPKGHTCTLQYTLTENLGAVASITSSGVLTFQKEGTVKVKIALISHTGKEAASKEITVTYAKVPLGMKQIEVKNDQTETGKLLLSMRSAEDKEEGVITFIEPSESTVSYTVSKGEGIVGVERKDSYQHIVPKKGGFATVKIAVTPEKEGEAKEYFIDVYVDHAPSELQFEFDGSACAETFSTNKTQASYTVSMDDSTGTMAGKKLYVTYQPGEKHYSADEASSAEGTIVFDGPGTVSFTAGVEYTEAALAFGAQANVITASRSIEVTVDAKSVTVTYGGVQTVNIATSQPTVRFAAQGSGVALVGVLPTNHTNTITYTLSENVGDIAKLTEGTLTFTKAGSVKVKIELHSKDAVTVEKEVTVSYAPVEGGKEVTLETGHTEPKQLALSMERGGETQNGILYFTNPEGTKVEYTVLEGESVIVQNVGGIWRIVPQKGGFSTVKVTVTEADTIRAIAAGGDETFTIRVYVDRNVTAEDISVQFNGQPWTGAFRTSRNEVDYTVTLSDDGGSMQGKKIYVKYGETTDRAEKDVLTLSGNVQFGSRDSYSVTFGVEYTEEAAALGASGGLVTVSREVTTSNGKLDVVPTITYEGGTLAAGKDNTIVLPDIGERIVFTVEKTFSPKDFELNIHKPEIVGNSFVGVQISPEGDTVTLTAADVCNDMSMTLILGGKSFTLKVSVHALADGITVQCGETLSEGNTYKTLLQELTLHVTLERKKDGKPITEKKVEYSLDGGAQWTECEFGEYGDLTVDVTALTEHRLMLRSKDQNVSKTYTIEHAVLEEYGLEFTVQTKETVVLGKIEAVAGNEDVQYVCPSSMQGSVTVKVLPTREDFLGGFGTNEEQFKSVLAITQEGGETLHFEYDGNRKAIVISNFDVTNGFSHTFTITCGEKSLSVTLSLVNLKSIEFDGFNSEDRTNGGDVYKGYQQVRVFAKRSDYGDGAGAVDFLRVPVVAKTSVVSEAKASPDIITWELSRVNGDTPETITVQKGKSVTFGGQEYTIVQSDGVYGLQKDGVPVEDDSVTWVDFYTEWESGIARVYFGAFKGLSESDVANDYFGNFDDRETYSKKAAVTPDGSGRDFTPSDGGAYSFLRVQAGDGAVGGTNCHFNFNVLDDEAICNVFNAAGYYAQTNIVLHEDLYGEGELDGNEDVLAKANEKKLFLTTANLGKTLIFGNGYQINLQAKTAAMDKYSESDGITIDRAYNTMIKCANPTDAIDNQHQKMVLKMTYAYYCDLSYYYKFNPAGNIFYTKNTVFSYVPKTAIQLYYDNNVLYAENIVMTECGTSVQADNTKEQNVKLYYKGTIDVLNYFNYSTLSELNWMISLMYSSVAQGNKDYLEWHGKALSGISVQNGKDRDKLYINLLAFVASDFSGKTYVWNGEEYKTLAEGGGTLGHGAKIAHRSIMSPYSALTYEMMNDEGNARLDNATAEFSGARFTGTADMNSLFSTNRYIRLQCEYKTPTVKNYDHIKWHKDNVYRDYSIIGEREDHIENLKETLKNTQWDDGSGVDGSGVPYGPSAALARYIGTMVAQTVIPGKQSAH